MCIATADFWGLKAAGGTATAYHLMAAALAKHSSLQVLAWHMRSKGTCTGSSTCPLALYSLVALSRVLERVVGPKTLRGWEGLPAVLLVSPQQPGAGLGHALWGCWG